MGQESARKTARMGADKMPPIVAAAALDLYAKRILWALLGETEALRVLGPELERGESRPLAALRDLGIPYRPAEWAGAPLTGACRKAFSRATARLEAAGLVSRVTEENRDRVHYLRLTPAGLRWGLRLVGRRADRAALAEGLGRTTWGKSLAAIPRESQPDRRMSKVRTI